MTPAELIDWLESDVAPVLTQILDHTGDDRAKWTAAFGLQFGPQPTQPKASRARTLLGHEDYRTAVRLALADYLRLLQPGDDWHTARFAGILRHHATELHRDKADATRGESRVKPRGMLDWTRPQGVPPNVAIHQRPQGLPMDRASVLKVLSSPYSGIEDPDAAADEISADNEPKRLEYRSDERTA